MDVKTEIIERIDIVDLISEYVELRRRGSNFVGLCPFHNEKTPSFTVSLDKKIFKCFGCGKAGNVITFLMDYLGLSYPQALSDLAKRAGIKLDQIEGKVNKSELSHKDQVLLALEQANRFFQINLNSQSGAIGRSYLANRGYLSPIIQEFQIGYAPSGWNTLFIELARKGIPTDILVEAGLIKKREGSSDEYFDVFRERIVFPIRNTIGKVVGFGGRILKEVNDTPKYINSPQTIVFDKSQLLYGLFEGRNEIRSQKSIILVEGYADVLSLHQAGFRNSVASCGTSLTEEQLNLLSKYCNTIYIAYDSDEAGNYATVRAIQLALPLGFEVLVVNLPQGEDPDSFIKKYGSASFSTLLDKAISFVEFLVRDAEIKGQLDRPAQKSQLIRTVIAQINSIPDLLQHSDYLLELANLLKVPYQNIQLLHNEKRKIFNSKNVKIAKTRKELNVSKFEHELMQIKSTLYIEEKYLIYYCLAEKRNFDFVKTALKFESSAMVSEEGKTLFRIIEEHSSHNILQSILLDERIDQIIKTKFIDISLNQEEPSENWRKFGYDPNGIDTDRILNDIVTKIKIRHIDIELKNIKNILSTNKEENNELLNKFQSLIERKQKLLKSLR